jgi:hypothetical protein
VVKAAVLDAHAAIIARNISSGSTRMLIARCGKRVNPLKSVNPRLLHQELHRAVIRTSTMKYDDARVGEHKHDQALVLVHSSYVICSRTAFANQAIFSSSLLSRSDTSALLFCTGLGQIQKGTVTEA